MSSDRIGVLGAGSWGTALAELLAAKGHPVSLWAYEPEVIEGINHGRQNPLYMSGLTLSDRIHATGDLVEAVKGVTMVLCVIPAQFVRGYLAQVRDHLPKGVPLVSCSKGIERKTLATMHQVFIEELPASRHRDFCALSGPSFAREVAEGRPTNVTAAAQEESVARQVQQIVSARHFRIYTSDDLVGVEIGGALKNVIAITVGASDGLNLGNNTRAGLITRGLAEVTRLAVNMGGRSETLLGLAGVGDLILTCTGDLSRNRKVGKLLAQGLSREAIQSEMRMVAEGIPTAESAYHLACRRGVELPITEQLYRVLYEGRTVDDAMAALQDRQLGNEWRP